MLPFNDLNAQYLTIKDNIQNRINTVLEHGQYIMGPEVAELEEKLANYIGVKECIAVSSGTDALLMALMALGVGPGDEVIIPDFSFFATAEVISLLGAVPVFAEVDHESFNLDPNKVQEKITGKTKAIMPVSMFGLCAELEKFEALAKENNLFLIEDGAQSFGASLNGRKSLSFGDMGCTSFFPAKPLGCYGDGGAVFTNNAELATKLKEIRNHGQSKRYYHTSIGINGRIDSIQAAVLIEKLKIFDSELAAKIKIAKKYNQALSDSFRVPFIDEKNISAWAQYSILVEGREIFQGELKSVGVPTSIHYPMPLSEQPVYGEANLNPITKKLCDQVISLPIHGYLKEDDQQRIIDSILSIEVS